MGSAEPVRRLGKEARLREESGWPATAKAHSARREKRRPGAHGAVVVTGTLAPALSPGLRPRCGAARASGARSKPALSREAQSSGGPGRRREARARGRGSALRAGAGRREATHPRALGSPSFHTRGAPSPALLPSVGAGEEGGIPEGIPPPPPASWRPRTHVSAGPARIPPAALRVPAPRPRLRRAVSTPALRRPRRVPAARAGRCAGLRLLHRTQRSGRGAGSRPHRSGRW